MRGYLKYLSLTDKGVTLIELMIALVISSILIAALYRVFISQQKTYTVQEQVTDMQQNARVGINRMMSEIRMAGFGNVGDVLGLPADVNGKKGVNGFTQAITPGPNTITIVGGFKQIRRDNGGLISISSASGNTITLNYATDDFDGAAHRFISIGGVESSTVLQRDVRVLTLSSTLKINHPVGTPIFKIQAITYTKEVSDDGKPVLYRNENTGGNRQPLADNIENIQFEYLDAQGSATANPANIRMVRATVTATTAISDDEYKNRKTIPPKRTIASNIYLRNMVQSP